MLSVSELEGILLLLPFNFAARMLPILVVLLRNNWDTELVCRCATFILRLFGF